MALTIANVTAYCRNFLKVDSNYGSAEEVRIANEVEELIVTYYRWHWNIVSATNIAVSAATQDYTMAAGDQNRVLAIEKANLLEGTTEQPELLVCSIDVLPRHSTQGQPIAVSLLSPTQVRFYPLPDATYTFQWRYYDRPTIHTANTESWDAPEALTGVVKAGALWKFMEFGDDERQEMKQKEFFALLENYKRREKMTLNIRRN